MIENRFAKLLGEKRLDRRDVVKMTGLDNHIILKIYKNQYTRIDLETLNKICMAWNVILMTFLNLFQISSLI